MDLPIGELTLMSAGLNVYIKEPGSTNHSTSSDKLHPVSTRPGAVPQVYIEVQLNETLVKTFTMEFPPSLSKIHETAVKSSFEVRKPSSLPFPLF